MTLKLGNQGEQHPHEINFDGQKTKRSMLRQCHALHGPRLNLGHLAYYRRLNPGGINASLPAVREWWFDADNPDHGIPLPSSTYNGGLIVFNYQRLLGEIIATQETQYLGYAKKQVLNAAGNLEDQKVPLKDAAGNRSSMRQAMGSLVTVAVLDQKGYPIPLNPRVSPSMLRCTKDGLRGRLQRRRRGQRKVTVFTKDGRNLPEIVAGSNFANLNAILAGQMAAGSIGVMVFSYLYTPDGQVAQSREVRYAYGPLGPHRKKRNQQNECAHHGPLLLHHLLLLGGTRLNLTSWIEIPTAGSGMLYTIEQQITDAGTCRLTRGCLEKSGPKEASRHGQQLQHLG